MSNFKLWMSAAAVLSAAACGRPASSDSTTKIVGGVPVLASDAVAKSTLALVSPAGEQFCTGSLISQTHVITAAHCLDELPWDHFYVVFGTTATRVAITPGNTRSVKTMVMHEHFDRVAMNMSRATRPPNDIALIQLATPAPPSSAPAAMLTAGDPLERGEKLTLAGFGVTHFDAQTSGILSKVTTDLADVDSRAHEIYFGGHLGRSACMGDSGGPAFVTRAGKLVLVGVTSRGSSACDENGIYTDVRYFRDWIRRQQSPH